MRLNLIIYSKIGAFIFLNCVKLIFEERNIYIILNIKVTILFHIYSCMNPNIFTNYIPLYIIIPNYPRSPKFYPPV